MASSSSSLSLALPSPPSSRTWEYNVFPSFHGPDVRKGLLSHLREKFISKGIGLFIDNEITRGESIGPELKRAIGGSQIAIVLLSRNYASSSWCLDELVEILKCRDLGQTVMTIFYEVEPTDIKKQTGYFGEVFTKTCEGKTKEKTGIWRKALESVATIAGYDLKNWDDEATMIETIATDISNKLNMSTLSCDFERFIGMGDHIENMKPLLRMDLDEVRMIGIWGPPGIGKSTIARFLFHKLSNSFQTRANMNIKDICPRLCRDEYNSQVELQSHMLSQMLHGKDMAVTHLGVAEQRLKDKKVLLILDDVDRIKQLDALAKETRWFGPGSRIIIVTEDVRVLTAHGINHIYTVDLPSDDEALKMFCMYAFGHNYPKDGFRELAWQVVCHAGKLPLGLEVMGCYFQNMSKKEWKNVLPKVWSSLDGKIESILKFSYDALDYEEKSLFLHLACLFVDEDTERVEEYLAKRFQCVSQGLDVLAKKSLISIGEEKVWMHGLLVQLGREIVRKQSEDPGKRQFLFDSGEISEILVGDATGTKSVIGINFVNFGEHGLNISGRAFEGMSNLQFLMLEGGAFEGMSKLQFLMLEGGVFEGMSNLQFLKLKLYQFFRTSDKLHLSHSLSYVSPKLRLLHWQYFPMICLPSNVNLKFLVELNMCYSKLRKLWKGIKPLPNLKRMYLSESQFLKKLPDLSTATNLEILDLSECYSLVKLPSSIENATNLQKLNFHNCSSLVKLPSSIGNFIKNLDVLDFEGCSSLSHIPSSIGNAINLRKLNFKGCSKLKVLPVNVNLRSLEELDLRGCSSLKRFPEISTNISYLYLDRTAIEKVPSSIMSWSRLWKLDMYDCKNLKEFPHALECKRLSVNVNLKSLNALRLRGCSSLKRFPEISTNIINLDLSETAIKEVPSSIMSWSRLEELDMSHCKNLKKFGDAFDSITEHDTKIQDVSPLVQGFSCLSRLIVNGCKDLVSLPQLPDYLSKLDADNCESLERIDCSFRSPDIHFSFRNCFKLNEEARDFVIQTSARDVSVLPGKEIPTYFTHQANGGSLIVKLNERPFPCRLKFKACILLVSKNVAGYQAMDVDCEIMDKQNSLNVWYTGGKPTVYNPLTEHLFIYKLVADAASNVLFFKFTLKSPESRKISEKWEIKECGVHCENCEAEEEVNESDIVDEEEENGSNGGRYICDY